MISRKRCKRIARDWVFAEAYAEYQRRMDDVVASQMRYGLPYDKELSKMAAGALLSGFYDPPMPRIPNIFQRLRLNDWTPPKRTDRMYTGARA